jgi:hypothetical protein
MSPLFLRFGAGAFYRFWKSLATQENFLQSGFHFQDLPYAQNSGLDLAIAIVSLNGIRH